MQLSLILNYQKGSLISYRVRPKWALLVHESIAQSLFEALKVKTENLQIGDGFDTDTQMGPMVSEQQLNQVKKYCDIATVESLTCLTGGESLARQGYFATPTIYIDVPVSSQL